MCYITSTLRSLGGLIDLVKGKFYCSELNRTFPLTLDPPGKKLPDGVVFDHSTPTIPQGVFSTVQPATSLFYYTSAEGRTRSRFSTSYSDHIIVHEKLF